MTDKNEVLELANLHLKESRYLAGESFYSGTATELLAFAAALEEKYQAAMREQHRNQLDLVDAIAERDVLIKKHQARIAELREVVAECERTIVVNTLNRRPSEKEYNALELCKKVLASTQQSADAFVARVRAEALEDGAARLSNMTFMENDIAVVNICIGVLNRMAAELRNSSAQTEGCSCANCITGPKHSSDCAVHNEPAMPNSDCNCAQQKGKGHK